MSAFEQKQAKRGYILAFRLAERMEKNHSTIYRWIKAGKIEAEQVEGRQWVRILSVRDYVGEQAWKIYGLDKVYTRMKDTGEP